MSMPIKKTPAKKTTKKEPKKQKRALTLKQRKVVEILAENGGDSK
jgi:hypothetical protein